MNQKSPLEQQFFVDNHTSVSSESSMLDSMSLDINSNSLLKKSQKYIKRSPFLNQKAITKDDLQLNQKQYNELHDKLQNENFKHSIKAGLESPCHLDKEDSAKNFSMSNIYYQSNFYIARKLYRQLDPQNNHKVSYQQAQNKQLNNWVKHYAEKNKVKTRKPPDMTKPFFPEEKTDELKN